MRIATLASVFVLGGCTSFSATINPGLPQSDAGPDAGGETGGRANVGGTSNTGGVSATGGGANATGGSSNAGGGSATGGGSNTGGVSGTGGASACTKNTDCVNPDPTNCSYTCVNPGASGTCKPAALIGPTQCITSACDDKAISGFWDAQGKPHIAYGWTETDGTASIRMQQLKLDGSLDGAAVAYKVPVQQQEPFVLSANAKGGTIGLLWESTIYTETPQAPTVEVVVDFAATDVAGAYSAPTEVVDYGNNSPLTSTRLWLQVTAADTWLAPGILQPNAPAVWQGTAGATIGGWTYFTPVTYSGEFSSGAVGHTLMLTGSDCASADSTCQTSFKLQRYSASNLSSIGPFISLSQNFQPNEWPAMGLTNGAMALLWTESQSPGQLFRTLINEDGTFALNVGTVASGISPRAVVQSTGGGALLIGTFAGGTPTTYQVVAQRLDASLGLTGSPLAIADAENTDATDFETHLSSDGRQVLITYSQAGAKYRLLSTNFCE